MDFGFCASQSVSVRLSFREARLVFSVSLTKIRSLRPCKVVRLFVRSSLFLFCLVRISAVANRRATHTSLCRSTQHSVVCGLLVVRCC